MPATTAAARASLRPSPADPPSPADGLREALLARVRTATAVEWASQDAELTAEIPALDAAGGCAVPSEDELDGLAPDPLSDPPDGEYGWLADLPVRCWMSTSRPPPNRPDLSR